MSPSPHMRGFLAVHPHMRQCGHFALPKSPSFMAMGTFCTAKKPLIYGDGDTLHCEKAPDIRQCGHFALPKYPSYMAIGTLCIAESPSYTAMGTLCTAKKPLIYGVVFEVECILKVVGGRGAVQSIPSTLLVWRKTSPIFTAILLVSGGP